MFKNPIVFIHMGNPKYLKKVINLASEYNSEIFLIGDDSNKHICKNWINAAELEIEDYYYFEKSYKHMSTNTIEFELGCFKRYYLLYALMNRININTCFMLDSDVCVYKNLNEINFENYDMACSIVDDVIPNTWCASPHSSFWKKDILCQFLSFLNDIYNQKDQRLSLIWNFHKREHIYGGISDMVLLRLWINDTSPQWKNLAVLEDGKVYDDNINCTCNYNGQKYQMRNLLFDRKIKKVFFEGKNAYFLSDDNQKVTTNIIHAQGEAKMYISCFTKHRNNIFSYYLADIYHESTIWISKLFS